MTFLTPSILWGLLAAALPILIHLFSQRNTREVEFSTLRFIKELEHETIRRLKLKQWLLVALRVLIIICLVLMFARPVQRGFAVGWMAGELESKVVMIVDNSASMAAEVDDATRLELARRAIPRIATIFEGQTQFELYQTNPQALVYSGNGEETAALAKAAKSISQTMHPDQLWPVVDSIMATIEVTEPNRECFIISDFPTAPSPDFADRFANDSLVSSWRFYCVAMPQVNDNLALKAAETVNQVRMANHLLKVNALIKNEGTSDRRNVPVEFYLDEERVGQVITAFNAGRQKDFLFQAFPGRTGQVNGRVTLPDDAYWPDNQISIDLVIPEKINVTLAGGSEEEIHLLHSALRSIDIRQEFLFIETRVDSQPSSLFLADSDVLIMYDPGYLSPGVQDEIKDFMQRGGGVIWFAGDRLLRQDNRDLEAVFNLPHARKKNALEGESYYSVAELNSSHPLLEDLELRNLENDLPQVFAYLDVSLNRRHTVVLGLNNERPLLVDFPVQGGRAFYFTSLLDLRWNDLAMRGLVVPLLHRMLILLATDETNARPLEVGGAKTIDLDREMLNNDWELVTPSGRRIILVPDFINEQLVVTQTDELGAYNILLNGDIYAGFSTRLSQREYVSERVEPDQIVREFPADRLRWIGYNSNLIQELRDTRFGRSLWRTFLILAIILMLMETILGRINPRAIRRGPASE